MTLLHYSRFVDHGMMMQLHGGGVGHKSMCEVTDLFLDNHDLLDINHRQQEVGDDNKEEDLGVIMDDEDGEENVKDDYGYVDHDRDDDMEWEDINDELDVNGLDSLGAEDGVNVANVVEDLGFADL
jgi:hypothetical protein